MADAVDASVEVHANRSLLFVEDAVPMLLAAFFQCAILPVTAQAAMDHIYQGALLAHEVAPHGELLQDLGFHIPKKQACVARAYAHVHGNSAGLPEVGVSNLTILGTI